MSAAKKNHISDILNRILAIFNRGLDQLPENARKVVETIILSLAAGVAAVVFLKATDLLFHSTYIALANYSKITFVCGSFALIVSSSLIVCLLLKKTPEAAGSGIPQLKVAYWKEMGFVPWRPILVKFIAGTISLGGGASLGREGPTLYLCGGLSSALSGYFGKSKRARRSALGRP